MAFNTETRTEEKKFSFSFFRFVFYSDVEMMRRLEPVRVQLRSRLPPDDISGGTCNRSCLLGVRLPGGEKRLAREIKEGKKERGEGLMNLATCRQDDWAGIRSSRGPNGVADCHGGFYCTQADRQLSASMCRRGGNNEELLDCPAGMGWTIEVDFDADKNLTTPCPPHMRRVSSNRRLVVAVGRRF